MGVSASSAASYQSLKAGVTPQWIKDRIHSKPGGGQLSRHRKQVLEPVDRLVVLTHRDVDTGQFPEVVITLEHLLADRHQLDCLESFADRVFFLAHAGIGNTERGPQARIVRIRLDLLREKYPR